MISSLKQDVILNLKNIYGWKTNRKIVVISVDDYGNVRLDSKEARRRMDEAGSKIYSRFDLFDTLETRQDLEMLFEALTSVKDSNGRNAVFTPFAMPCNINFEAMAQSGFDEYIAELLPETYNKLEAGNPAAYAGTWQLWKEGISKGLLVPQFHGREHLNLKVFNEKLRNKDKEVLTSLINRSYTSIGNSGYATISVMAAFEFWDYKENEAFKEIIIDGLNAFEKVFGYRSNHFNPPGGREHPVIHETLKANGVKYIDTPLIKQEHQGKGKYKKVINYTGKSNSIGQIYQVRNVVYEPTDDRGVNWINFTMKQIESAFRWNRPAIISSHRVNFCGHIDPQNREKGIKDLSSLLKKIVQKWPEVEFMAANELGDVIAQSK